MLSGFLKGRWRILKVGIRLLDIKSVDKIWLTCCALHIMLLEEDGLDQPWDGITVPTSEWEMELSNLEPEDCPAALVRLLDPAAVRSYDNSAMGTPFTKDAGIVEEADASEGGVRYVKNMSMKLFHSKLVEHFDIKWRMGEIVWSKTLKVTLTM
jgi:hypothetical protein